MADASVTVIDGRAVVTPFGADLLTPLVASASGNAASAAVSAAAAATAQTAIDLALAAISTALAMANTFATKAAATAAISGVAANAYVQVLADESLSSHRTIYQKVSGAYVLALDCSILTGNVTSTAPALVSGAGSVVAHDLLPPASMPDSGGVDNAVRARFVVAYTPFTNGPTGRANYTDTVAAWGVNIATNFTPLNTAMASGSFRIESIYSQGGPSGVLAMEFHGSLFPLAGGPEFRWISAFIPHAAAKHATDTQVDLKSAIIHFTDGRGYQRAYFDFRAGVSAIDWKDGGSGDGHPIHIFGTNDKPTIKQSNAAGTASLSGPYIGASDQLIVSQIIEQAVDINGAALNNWFNAHVSATAHMISSVETNGGDAIRSFVNNGGGGAFYSEGIDASDGNSFVISKAFRALGTGNILRCDGATDRWKGLVRAADNFADDVAAATGGVAINELYHNAGAVRVRLT